jgi:hypothetical protein
MPDPYWSDTVFLGGFEGASPTDESLLAQTVTVYGSAAVSATQAKFGSKSLRVPTDSCVGVPDNAAFLSGTTPFTLEAFVWFNTGALFNNAYNPIIAQWEQFGAVNGFIFFYKHNTGGGWLQLDCDTDADGAVDQNLLGGGSQLLVANTWYHLCVDFDGTKYRAYIDGALHDSQVASVAISNPTCAMYLGNYPDNTHSVFQGVFDGYIDEARVTVGVARYASDGGFTVPSSAFPRGSGYDVVVSDGVGMSDLPGNGTFGVLTSGVGVHQSGYVTWPKSLAESLWVYDAAERLYRTYGVLTDTAATAPTLAGLRGLVLQDAVALAPVLTLNQRAHLVLADTVSVALRQAWGAPVGVSDTVALTLTQNVQSGLQLLDTLGLLETVAGAAHYHKTLADSVALASTLGRFIGLAASDVIHLAETTASLRETYALLADTAGIAPTLAPRFLLHVVLADGVDITPAQAVQAIYRGDVLHDGIELSIAYVAPDGSVTTWAMNARTRAVTEYDNFAFNSFAKMGNVYLGAREDGLYELTGDDDAGTPIVAHLRSGFMQFGGTQLSRIKAAYIATRGAGDFVLKIDTGDGTVVNYGLSTRGMRTTKVHMGKGLRARYFAFELTGDGTDFDLDTLEFVPIVLQRRV